MVLIKITRYVSKNIFITFSTLLIKNTNDLLVILNILMGDIAVKYCELFADTPNYLATCSKYMRPNSPKWNLNTQISENTKINT